MKTKLKRDLMPNRIKKAKKELTKLSHDFVRRRDSQASVSWATPESSGSDFQGICFDCPKFSFGQDFQCGHWIPDSVGGASLRYHPHNMHGQSSGCNCGYQQEMVKIRYTNAMIQKYGQQRVDELLRLKNRTIKADIIWYEKMIKLYKEGVENSIVAFLEN